MKLRTRLDWFSATLLSALGASPLVACGGSAFDGGAGAGQGGTGGTSTQGGSGGVVIHGGSGGTVIQGGSGGAGAAGHGGMAVGGGPPACTNPVVSGGTVTCEGGLKHHPGGGSCDSSLPRPDKVASATPTSECQYDSDCTEKPYGWCGGGGQIPGAICQYGCVTDSDCAAGTICECGSPVGACVASTCTSDAQCGSGLFCRSFDGSHGCGFTSYACQSAADECTTDADCGAGKECAYAADQAKFTCQFTGCAIGRPFLVEGHERMASAVRRADWRELIGSVSVADLAGMMPARLASEWTRVALMEHASIAAFARFTLQLMSLGAPPELIERATRAMADETKHAKACFAVASAYAGEPVGPGALAVERSLDEMSLVEIVVNTIREGCIGETVAAIEAREAAEHASDPTVRALLQTISEDETRHAELAYEFVKWALASGDASVHAAVEREFAAIARESEAAPESLNELESELLANGVLPRPLRAAVRAAAIADVILPCAYALFVRESGYPGAAEPYRAVG